MMKETMTRDEARMMKGQTWYHGTAEAFDAFDPDALGTGVGGAGTDDGFWFTDDDATADLYAEHLGGGTVIEAEIDVDAARVVDVEKIVRDEADMMDFEADDYAELYRMVFPVWEALGDLIREEIDAARAAGAEAVIFRGIIDTPGFAPDEGAWGNEPAAHAVVFDADAITIR